MGFTRYACTTLEKGLYLEERKGAKNYRAKCLLFGKYETTNTGFSEFVPASKFARSWFRQLRSARAGVAQEGAFLDSADGFLASLPKESTRDFYGRKLHALAEHFRDVYLTDVTPKFLADFLKARRAKRTRAGTQITNNTLKKDFVFINSVLKWSIDQGLLGSLPQFPKVGKIESNPRRWLELGQWKALRTLAEERISDPTITSRTRSQRAELLDFMEMMVHTCARVYELLGLRVKDCVVDPTTIGGVLKPHLFVHVEGKTGGRTALGWPPAVDALDRLIARRSLGPEDLLFEQHHRDGFRELLIAAKLRLDSEGKTRNLKSLRSTGLMFRILAGQAKGGVDLATLARHAGTSIQMLDKYYLKALTVKINANQLAAPNDVFFLAGVIVPPSEDPKRPPEPSRRELYRMGVRVRKTRSR
jgi:integrase